MQGKGGPAALPAAAHEMFCFVLENSIDAVLMCWEEFFIIREERKGNDIQAGYSAICMNPALPGEPRVERIFYFLLENISLPVRQGMEGDEELSGVIELAVSRLSETSFAGWIFAKAS